MRETEGGEQGASEVGYRGPAVVKGVKYISNEEWLGQGGGVNFHDNILKDLNVQLSFYF